MAAAPTCVTAGEAPPPPFASPGATAAATAAAAAATAAATAAAPKRYSYWDAMMRRV